MTAEPITDDVEAAPIRSGSPGDPFTVPCGHTLWAQESIRRGYCEGCRLSGRDKTTIRAAAPRTARNGRHRCPGCERMHGIRECFPGCGTHRPTDPSATGGQG